MTNTEVAEAMKAHFQEAGRRAQQSLMRRFYAQVDAQFPDLDDETRERLAQTLRIRHMNAIGRLGGRPKQAAR